MTSLVIAPSILAADYTRLGEEARKAELEGADWLHVDVMDGQFVPNITFGPGVVAALKRVTRLPLDVHLMIEHPEKHVDAFRQAGADRLTVHIEAQHDMARTLQQIRKTGCRPGITLNPATDVSTIEKFLPEVDLVLCMTVVPGFGGQEFMTPVLEKIHKLAKHPSRKNRNYWIEVDGGINLQTVRECVKAGANAIVAGTALFGALDFGSAIMDMRKAACEAEASLKTEPQKAKEVRSLRPATKGR
jgi:ribulose-phosphate 3-epimerase